MKFGKKLAAALLGILCAGCLAGGLTACKPKGPTGIPENATTYRLALPNDGSAPTAHTGLENIGYMAYALDRQESYHAYAHCASKASGYTQITQTWKDYKDKIMICSDLSYSMFVKAGTQTCFVNNEAYMRKSEAPSSSTTATNAKWKTSQPSYYNRAKYLETYGEFSTELSVYAINEETIKSWGEVTVNEDGTYSQSFSLKSNAACYYQYGMKTRGGLKGYPVFSGIDITFTFDNNWRVLSSYCVENSTISPNSLGGVPMKSTSNTTTAFSYGESAVDGEHYGYYDSYFKQYVGKLGDGVIIEEPPERQKPDLLTVLGSAFGGVVAGGEQFNAELTVGQTEYDGKIYLSLSDLGDVLGSIDARVALGKKNGGKQDLYIGFADGEVNAYYSDGFAASLNIGAVSAIVGQFGDWVERFENNGGDNGITALSYALSEDGGGENGEESGGGFDIASLLGMFDLEEADDGSVTVSVETDDLLGTGIGARLYLYCGFENDTYIFNELELESISYGKTSIDLHAKITPDKDGEKISHNKAEACANLADYAAGVHSMLNSDTVKVTLDFDGSKQEVISALQGLNVSAEAYVELGYNLATRVDLTAEYSDFSAELSVYYGNNIDFKSKGKIFIDLVKVNGEDVGAKVYCDIDKTVDAVYELLGLINGNAATSNLSEKESEGAAKSVADIINGVLNLDFGEVLGEIYASNSEIRVSVDIDAVVGALGVDVKGVKFGTAALALNLEDEKANLSLTLAALGLEMTVSGCDGLLTVPEAKDYLNAEDVIKLVSEAVKETKLIINAQAAAFNIDALVTVDGVPMHIVGSGEVCWADDSLKIGVDAVLTVADGTSAAGKDEVALKLYYISNPADSEPFIRFAVNGTGMEIYDKDLSSARDGLQKIIDSVNLLLNGEKSGNATAQVAAELYNTSVGLDGGNLSEKVGEVVGNDNIQKIFSAVLGFVKDLSVSAGYNIEDETVNRLIINHALYGNVTLAADGGLSLDADITDKNGTQILSAVAVVKAGDGTAFEKVNGALDKCDIYSTAETEEAFVKIVYNYLFAVVEEELSVAQTLGNNTYEVKINLDGKKSDIPALKDVTAEATLYYTQGLKGDKIKGDKLAEIDLNLNIGKTAVKVNVRYNDEKIYLSLDKIGNTALNEIKFYASKDDISSAVEELVRIITDEKVIDTLSKLIPAESGNPEAFESAEQTPAAQAESGALNGLIEKIITFDFASAFSFKKVDGANTATVDIDAVTELFGADTGFKIGTAHVEVNPKTHAVSGGVSLDGEDWVTLSAERAARRDYADGWQSAYINAGFVSTLVSDLYKTVTDDAGNIYSLYTFAGKVDVAVKVTVLGININKTIELDVTSLTLGLNEDGEFYLTILANLKECKVATFTLAAANNISITYSGGKVTLGRGVGTDGAVFKVMTLDYLLENAFAKYVKGNTDSPIRWLLGMNDTVWNVIAGNVPSLVSNGTPVYTLYDSLAQASKSGSFYLSKFLTGFAVNVNGGEVSSFGTGSAAADALGLNSNYYALQLNAKALTGGILSNLYIGLTRSDSQGVNGIKAFGTLSVSPAELKFTVNLNEYKEGVTTLYESGDITGEYAAPDYYKAVTAKNKIDFEKTFESGDNHIVPVFGCYTAGGDNDGAYESVNTYSKVKLTVKYGDTLVAALDELGLETNEDGVYFSADDISYSSIVYLRTPFAPTWVDSGNTYKIIYTTDKESLNRIPDTDGDKVYMRIWDDTEIFAQVERSVMINFVTGVDGVGTISGGFAENAELSEYPVGGYAFRGWYADKERTVKAELANDGNIGKVDGVLTVYGMYFIEQTVVDGVIYSYTDNAYSVTGFDEYGIKKYTESGSTLILQSGIDGYPVTEIAANAFKDVYAQAGAGLKNVVVPESVVKVGAAAFGDNYGLERVVFLADEVYLCGTEKNTVFYGCSTVSGGNRTEIEIYYNTIKADTAEWTYFRDGGHRIGTSSGGTLYPNGNWSYADVTFSGSEISKLDCISSGLKSGSMTAEQIEKAVIAELNAKTSESGYINGYEVSVDGDYFADGKLHAVNIAVNKATPYYLVSADVAGVILEGAEETYNGKVYVKAGTQVKALPPDGYEFITLSGADGLTGGKAGYTFEMPAKSVALSGEVQKVKITSVTVNSAVAFTYGGVEYSAGSMTVSGVEEGVTVLETPCAEGYIFLGWAYANGNVLEFASSAVQYSTYYAIWADDRDGLITGTEDGATLDSGSDPNALKGTVDTARANSFYAWYTDASFENRVDTLNKDTTVLYARVYYTLTVNAVIDGSVSSSEITVNGSKQSTYSTAVLESDKLYVKDVEENSKVVKIYSVSDNVTPVVDEIRIKAKTSILANNESKALVIACSDSNWKLISDKVEISNNVTFTFTYKR